MEKKKIIDKFLDLDKRIIYTILLIILASPLISPLGLPVPVSEMTMGVYNALNEIKPGDNVLCLFGLQPPDVAEIGPHMQLLLQHIINRGGRAVIIDFQWTMGGVMQDQYILPKIKGLKYGENVVNIGWVPGGSAAQAKFAEDIWSVTQIDHYGNKFEDLPLMRECRKLSDFKLICSVGIVGEALGTIIMPSKLPAIRGVWAVSVAEEVPYWKAGQYKGILAGSLGAAEYGNLLGIKTRANAMMDAISASHIFILILVIMGNIIYLFKHYRGRGK
jgi:hypothetical protein